MRIVWTNAELGVFHAAAEGLVFNDVASGPAGAEYNVLHAASCLWVGRMLDQAQPLSRPSVRKVLFTTPEEAAWWLASNRGLEGHGWRRCATCRSAIPW